MAKNIGSIFATVRLDVSGLNKDIGKVSKLLNGLTSQIGKSMGGAKVGGVKGGLSAQIFGDPKQAIGAANTIQKSLQDTVGTMGKVNVGVRQTADGFKVGMASISQSVGTAKKPLFDFKTFVGQIAHYISFSIGVQMVMMVKQGIQQMVEIFKEFEKAVYNAAAVSGYLGKSFDKATEKISALSIELAQKTIFTATETSKVMYSLACLPPDEIILKGDYTPIEASYINVGDYVIGKSGLPTLVKKTFKRPCIEKTLINVNPYYVDSFKVTPNHPLLVIRPKECKHQTTTKNTRYCKSNCNWNRHRDSNCEYFRSYKPEWVDAGKVLDSDCLLIPIIKDSEVYEIDWFDYGKYSFVKKKIKLPNKVDEDFAYLLGKIVADGWITEANDSVTIIFNDTEEDIQLKIENYIRSLGLNIWHTRDGDTTTKLHFSSRLMMKFIKRFIGKYAHNKRIPEFIFKSPNNIIASFLKGYIDGDGHINKYDYPSYHTVSDKINRSINLLFARFGGIASQHLAKGKYMELPSGWSGVTRDSWQGRVNDSKVLERLGYKKQNKHKSMHNLYFPVDNYIAIPIHSIKKEHYDGDVYNIETEDNTFMTSVVTHNSAGIDPVRASVEDLIPILNYAAATQTDLKEATDAVLIAMKQFNLGLEDSEMIVDTWTALIGTSFATMQKLNDGMRYTGQIAGALNQDFREVSSALAVLNNRGYEGGQAGQRLNMIFTKLISPTDKGKRMLAELGLTLSDIDPSINSLVEILYKLKEAEFDVGDSTQLFRARTAAAAVTLVESADEVAEFTTYTKEMAGITESIAEKQLETLEAKFKGIASAAQEASIIIVDRFNNALDTMGKTAGLVGDTIGSVMSMLTGEADLGWIGQLVDFLSPITGFLKGMELFKEITLGPIEEMKNWSKAMKRFNDVSMDGSDILSRFTDSTDSYSDSIKNVASIREQLRSMEQQGQEDTVAYTEMQKQLLIANRNLAKSESGLIETSGEILDIMIDSNTNIANGISSYQNLYKAESEMLRLEDKRESLLRKEGKLEEELNEIRDIRGAHSEQYITTMSILSSTQSQLATTSTEIGNKQSEVNELEEEYNELLDNSSEGTRTYIELAQKLIDTRGELFRLQNKFNKAQAEYNRLIDIETNYEKYLNEAMIPIYELEDKLYDIELKRYKLKEDNKSLNEDLFEQLAEQGLLTQEVIDEYVDWQEAEAEVMKLHDDYADVIGNLTEEELALVEAYMAGEDVDISGIAGASVIMAMRAAMQKAAQEQAEYSQVAGDIAQHYVDIGIASNDVATTLTELNQQSNDLAQTEAEHNRLIAEQAEKYATIAALKVTPADMESAKADMDSYYAQLEAVKEELLLIAGEYDVVITTTIPDFTVLGEASGEAFIDGIIKKIKSLASDLLNIGIWIGRKILNSILSVGGLGNFIGNLFAGGGIVGLAKGGVTGLQTGIRETKGAQLSMIGEAGPEAVIPLAGSNRKYGLDLLKQIIPKYFPDLRFLQQGGTAGGSVYLGAQDKEQAEMVKVEGADDIARALAEMPNASEAFKQMVIEGGQLSGDLFIESTTGAGDQFYTQIKDAGAETYKSESELMKMGLLTANDVAGIAMDTANAAQSNAFVSQYIFRQGVGLAGIDFFNRVSALNLGSEHQKGGIYNKATAGVFGEAGAEALIPLEGRNKKYGAKLLETILPKYYPEMLGFQTGGIFGGGGGTTSNTYNSDSYSINGPINVITSSPQDFMEQLKRQYRASKRR